MSSPQTGSRRRPDSGSLAAVRDERERRARAEPMRVRPLGAGRYEVTGASGHHYLVSYPVAWCTCPDNLLRRVRCKHLRRVANEVALGSLPAPDTVVTLCASCDTETAVPAAMTPALCSACRLAPGDVAIDRETGDAVVVVEVLTDRADEVPIPEALTTVASYPANRRYPPRDPVVRVVYPASIRPVTHDPESAKRYAFPLSRLRRLDTAVPGGPTTGVSLA